MATKDSKAKMTSILNDDANKIKKEIIRLKLLYNIVNVFFNHMDMEDDSSSSDVEEMTIEEQIEFLKNYKGNIYKLRWLNKIILEWFKKLTTVTIPEKEEKINNYIKENNNYLKSHDSYNDRLISDNVKTNEDYINVLIEFSMFLLSFLEFIVGVNKEDETTPEVNNNTTPGEVVNKP